MCSFPSHSSATRVGIGTVLGRNEPCFLINILLKGSIILKPKRFSYKFLLQGCQRPRHANLPSARTGSCHSSDPSGGKRYRMSTYRQSRSHRFCSSLTVAQGSNVNPPATRG